MCYVDKAESLSSALCSHDNSKDIVLSYYPKVNIQCILVRSQIKNIKTACVDATKPHGFDL